MGKSQVMGQLLAESLQRVEGIDSFRICSESQQVRGTTPEGLKKKMANLILITVAVSTADDYKYSRH